MRPLYTIAVFLLSAVIQQVEIIFGPVSHTYIIIATTKFPAIHSIFLLFLAHSANFSNSVTGLITQKLQVPS